MAYENDPLTDLPLDSMVVPPASLSGGTARFAPDPADPAVVRCTSMFNRVLASWASDLLNLQHEGLATPGWRERVDDDGALQWRRAA